MSNLTGTVTFVSEGHAYFCIKHVDQDGRTEEFFGHTSEVHLDTIGRKNIRLGSEVTFAAGERAPGARKRRALHIRGDASDLDGVDLASYREYGRIRELVQTYTGRGAIGALVGLIVRDSESGEGDLLPFRAEHIISEITTPLALGDWLYYGVQGRTNPKGEITYQAANIRTCYRDGEGPEPEYEPGSIEAQLLLAPELPVSEPAPPKDGERVYSDSDRRLSLRELISKGAR